MSTYERSPSWTDYRDLLSDRFGIHIHRSPREEWVHVRGHDVHLDVWEPEGTPAGTVILVHGGGGNGRVLAPFADLVAAMGWRAIAPDLPGYGLTRPAPGFRGDYDEWPAVVAHLADTSEGPVVLMGLSVGGMTAACAAEASGGVAGVISTTLLDLASPSVLVRASRWRWLGALSLIGFRLLPWLIDRLSLPVWLVAPMGAMSSDVRMGDYFGKDPLLGRLLVRLRFFRTLHAHQAARSLGCPLLLVHPGADRWTPTALSRRAFDRLQGPKELVELSNGSHLPLEQPARDELREHVRRFLASLRAGQAASPSDGVSCAPTQSLRDGVV